MKVFGQRFAVVPDTVLYAKVPSHAKVLWAILSRHADPEGHCYPAKGRLADLMGVSGDTVRRAKEDLVEAGLMTCRPRYDDTGRRTSDDVCLSAGVGSTGATYPPVLQGDSGTGATYVGSTGATTELKPEEETPRNEVASGVSRVGGGKNGPPAQKTGSARYACRVCGTPATLSLGGSDNWLCEAHQPRTAQPDVTLNADAVQAIKDELGWAK